MDSFSFGRQIQIHGKTYTMDLDNQETVERFLQKAEEVKSGNSLAIRECVDIILGTGSYDDIFDGWEPTETGLTYLVVFLTIEAYKHVAEARTNTRRAVSLVERAKAETAGE